MYIVIPMAGASSRFYNAGYTVPKYMLPLGSETVFDKSVRSFEKYFDTARFIFIIRADDAGACDFLQDHIAWLRIKQFDVVVLDTITRGQAETVYEALKKLNLTKSFNTLAVFNIDTIRKNLDLAPYTSKNMIGTFDAFYDENADESKWSFCEVDNKEHCIIRTAEKKKISNWCSTGLYIFGFVRQFSRAYEEMSKMIDYNFYIAPLYNYFFKSGGRASAELMKCQIDDVEFSGVPDEYEALKKKYELEERS